MRDTTAGPVQASGRFVLRVPPALHAALRDAAREAGLSLNELCVRALASAATPGPGADVATRALAAFGDELVGVVLYGSWARGEASASSDVDALVVLGPGTPVTRATYRAWDEAPLTHDGRDLDVHFATLPADDAEPSALWLEVATDGLVIHDRGLRLGRYLGRLRRRLAAGAWTRHEVHGHPYWTAN